MNFTNLAMPKGTAKSSAQAVADWFYGKTRGGQSSFYIDPRTPNGGGSYVGKEWSRCAAWNPV
jgi:hypothetical protein